MNECMAFIEGVIYMKKSKVSMDGFIYVDKHDDSSGTLEHKKKRSFF